MERPLPKILVVSHNSFSAVQNNGKTLQALFEGWPSDRIAQLFFHDEVPNFEVCKNFFRITDADVFRAIIRNNGNCGQNVKESKVIKKTINVSKGISFQNLFKLMAKYKLEVMYLLRDLIWSSNRWKTNKFLEWLDRFSPEVVFFVGSNYRFSYNIALWIANERNIPFMLFCTDDYVTSKPTTNLFWWIKYWGVKNRFIKAINIAKRVFVIGDAMANEYSSRFGRECTVIMNSVDIPKIFPNYKKSDRKYIKLVYAGNLGLNRWQPLTEINEYLMELRKNDIYGKMYIYSLNVPSGKVFNALNNPPSMGYYGSLKGDQLKKEIQDADIVIHVESFDKKNRHLTRLSMSTKIPEYLALGKCILAYGPSDVASIKYLIDNNAAVVACNRNELKQKLDLLLNGIISKSKMGRKAYDLAIRKHQRTRLADLL